MGIVCWRWAKLTHNTVGSRGLLELHFLLPYKFLMWTLVYSGFLLLEELVLVIYRTIDIAYSILIIKKKINIWSKFHFSFLIWFICRFSFLFDYLDTLLYFFNHNIRCQCIEQLFLLSFIPNFINFSLFSPPTFFGFILFYFI